MGGLPQKTNRHTIYGVQRLVFLNKYHLMNDRTRVSAFSDMHFYVTLLIFNLLSSSVISTSVSSCNQLGWLNAETYGDEKVCGSSEILSSCSGLVGLEEANSFCSFIGARLCTVEELLNDEARGTGCSSDARIVWSSSTCEDGTYVALGSTKSGVYSNCSSNEESHYTRCCADVFSNINTTISASSCEDLGWDPDINGSPLVCGESEMSKQCSGQITFDEAQLFCEEEGARLCTLSELWANEVRSTGCALDSELVWSNSECDEIDNGMYVALGGSSNGLYSNCTDTTSETRYARCCADVFNSTGLSLVELDDVSDIGTDDSLEESSSSCSTLGWNTDLYGSTQVCGGSEIGGICSLKLSWSGAESYCASGGARLCTLQELWDDEARASGCALDRTQVWSKTACGLGSHITTYGSQIISDGTFQNCTNDDEGEFFTRCCADVFTPEPTNSPTVLSLQIEDDETEETWNLHFMRGSLRPILNIFAFSIACLLMIMGYRKYCGQRSKRKLVKQQSKLELLEDELGQSQSH